MNKIKNAVVLLMFAVCASRGVGSQTIVAKADLRAVFHETSALTTTVTDEQNVKKEQS